ncbi:hypothetical protein BSLA_01r3346 [Burkholderia stabilis]|nr:hypothetical protein BSLA_01r3346 [Burkholderia stabilis]
MSAMTSGPDKRVFPWLGGVIDIPREADAFGSHFSHSTQYSRA